MPEPLTNAGKFLSAAEAQTYLQDFLDSTDAITYGSVTNSVVTGQVLGLSYLKDLIASIDRYNAGNAGNAEKEIVAVRIYYAKSRRSKNSFPKKITDVLLMPVKANGEDVSGTDLGKADSTDITGDDKMILGEAVPCPNLC